MATRQQVIAKCQEIGATVDELSRDRIAITLPDGWVPGWIEYMPVRPFPMAEHYSDVLEALDDAQAEN